MKLKNDHPKHPGILVKENILPKDISVKKAAEMMGIGRPALSNFLNGKANLSQDMATRLAKAFGASKTELLNQQKEYSTFLGEDKDSQIAVRTYAPSFLNIRANDIDAWANKIESRSLLPALLRLLVNSTGSEISHSDFPAYDNSQRHGWDGQVESNNVTPWVPSGIAGWEFGCNKNPSKKADDDYSNRTKNVPINKRKNTTYIFVTPRMWNKKDEWIQAKKEKNEWKDIRAYDANDLEQWLERSVIGQVWLAEKLGIPTEECKTLDEYWTFWSDTASPTISRKIFNSAIAVHSNAITKWYQSVPNKPLVITAGSKEEALAFIACVSYSLDELKPFAEQAVLVSSANTAKRLVAISTEFIPIAHTASAETELVMSFKNRHSIVVVEKSLTGIEPDLVVDLPSYESFRDALTEMGFGDAQIEIHSSQSGKSPTILRRQLATVPAFKRPGWASTNERIRLMVPLVLAGKWKSDQDGDKEILKYLIDVKYPDIEKSVAELVSIDDAPIWSEGKYRGVVSKLDCFHAISNQITEDDLSKFFFVAEHVLSDDDPALDLDKDKRWAANLYDKVRYHSDAIRESICDNLIILSIHGNNLFGKRLGINIESSVNLLIRKLLNNQSGRVWQSQQGDLPRYAEAAPDEFLGIVESELAKSNPAFAQLFEPVDGGVFSRCERTGMLWALELLAWEPSRLSRVIRVLAKLCAYELEDNWANKPIGSLKDILLSWMPHTSATIEQRCDVLELLCQEHPDVGWNICMGELKPGQGHTSGTYRPRWRSDASGVGQGVIPKEHIDFLKKCRELVLSWPTHTNTTLSDLIDCLAGMDNKDRATVTKQIEAWFRSSPTDEDIIALREHVRIRTMTQGARKRNKGNANRYADGKKIYEMLEPKEIILKHQWLFAKLWVEYSPEELKIEELNHEARDEELSKQRTAALKEVLEVYGTDGLIKLCLKGEAGSAIGFHLTIDILNPEELQTFVIKCLSTQAGDHSRRIDNCLSGILYKLDDEKRQIFIRNLINKFVKGDTDFDKINRLFINAPFTRSTWDILKVQHENIQKKYWENINPRWHKHSSEDLNFLIGKLLEVNRPRAAFDIAHLNPDRIKSKTLIRLLNEVATNTSEPVGHFRFSTYEIEQTLKSLNKRSDVNRSELVRLEYIYIDALTPISEYGIPNLSKEISESPLSFMHLLALCFRRDDDGEDPEEWKLPKEPEHAKKLATNAYNVLEYASVIPGTQDDGSINVEQLRDWINKVRTLAKENGRLDIADERIGQILSKSSTGKDGIWPREEIRTVFEEVASKEISTGMEIGLSNSRGVESRPDDGAPERMLASKYHRFAEEVMNKNPFVSRMLLNIAKSYEHEAEWHDTDGRVRKRLHG